MTKPQSPARWLYRGCRYWLHWSLDSMAQHSGDFRPHSPCCIISYWNCYTSLQPSPKIQWFCSKYTRTRVSDSILTNTDLPYLDKCSSAQTKQSEEYLSLSKLQREKKKKRGNNSSSLVFFWTYILSQWMGCHSERPKQGQAVGPCELHDIQQIQRQGLLPGVWQPLLLVQASGCKDKA